MATMTAQMRAINSVYANNSVVDAYGESYKKIKWGVNGEVARMSFALHAEELVVGANKTLEDVGLRNLDRLFGRNPWGRSFVTKLGKNPASKPHHRPSMVYDDAWPGYLVGGPYPSESSWSDSWLAFRSNEVAINWQAGLIYSTARYYQCTERERQVLRAKQQAAAPSHEARSRGGRHHRQRGHESHHTTTRREARTHPERAASRSTTHASRRHSRSQG